MTDKHMKIALAAVFAGSTAFGAFLLEVARPVPADGCIPCDCSGAVVALPADVTALAADASAVTAVAK